MNGGESISGKNGQSVSRTQDYERSKQADSYRPLEVPHTASSCSRTWQIISLDSYEELTGSKGRRGSRT